MPMVELRGLSALEAWTRKVTAGYKDVKVHDLSTSWRDGLAFCALIHHFRPDLIDFDSLSKENILFNNRLAFQTAEKHLGVPSLLDAEDMFKHEEPDRLSVATYLSQFYECFEGSKSDRKHSITNSRQSVETEDNLTITNSITTGAIEQSGDLANRPIPPRRDMKCQKCKTRVYILDRLLIDDKCYHKSCYDSLTTSDEQNLCQTDSTGEPLTQKSVNSNENEINLSDIKLNINSFQQNTDNDSNTEPIVGPKQAVCAVDSDITSDQSMVDSIDTQIDVNSSEAEVKSIESRVCEQKIDNCFDDTKVEMKSNESYVESEPKITSSFVDRVFEEAFGEDSAEDEVKPNEDHLKTTEEVLNSSVIDVKTTQTTLKCIEDEVKTTGSPVNTLDAPVVVVNDKEDKDLYPDDKNPFGDEEEEEDNEMVNKHLYPDEKNPFGDDDSEEEVNNSLNCNKIDIKISETTVPSDPLNPFGDDIEDEDNYEANNTPKPKPRQSLSITSPSPPVVSPTSSLRSRKKRPAPTPPPNTGTGIPQVNSSASLNSSFIAISEDSSRRDSMVSTVSSDFTSSATNSRTPTPLPRHRLQKSSDDLTDNQQNCDQNSVKTEISLKSNDSETDLSSKLKLKKRPAPPIPAVKRIVKGSLAEIEEELNGIGDQLPIVEQKGKDLEQILMSRPITDQQSNGVSKDDKEMNDFLSTARERCRLARRQKELMYMKREHKLEEIQADIEYQMRCVISKQSAQKTTEDEKQEEELLQRLIEIIEERNDIIENMIKDENKEVEEYQKLISKVLPQKPDLKPKPKQSISGSDIVLNAEKSEKQKTIDKNLIKIKEKLKLKEIKEKKKLKKLQKSAEKSTKVSEKCEKSAENVENNEKPSKSTKHLTLKSTLKPLKRSLGLKTSEQKSDKKSDKNANNSSVSEDTNASNASIK